MLPKNQLSGQPFKTLLHQKQQDRAAQSQQDEGWAKKNTYQITLSIRHLIWIMSSLKTIMQGPTHWVLGTELSFQCCSQCHSDEATQAGNTTIPTETLLYQIISAKHTTDSGNVAIRSSTTATRHTGTGHRQYNISHKPESQQTLMLPLVVVLSNAPKLEQSHT